MPAVPILVAGTVDAADLVERGRKEGVQCFVSALFADPQCSGQESIEYFEDNQWEVGRVVASNLQVIDGKGAKLGVVS